jgi:hypothetical protein
MTKSKIMKKHQPGRHKAAIESYSDATLRLIVRDLRRNPHMDSWSRERLAAMEAELAKRAKP